VIVRIDASAALPVYEQIRQQVTLLVASGQLRTGERLPTIRQLATDLGIARGTVERAYEHLATDGVVDQKGRQGTVVSDRPLRVDNDTLAVAAETFAVTAVQAGASEAAALAAVREALRAVTDWA
jgi:DNA-binding transcriptional regulator YhcF (GntR family)